MVTLLLTAFGSGGSSTAEPPIPLDAVADATALSPQPRVLATIGNLHLQLPVAARVADRDRVPRHERRLALAAAGRAAGERGPPRPALAPRSPVQRQRRPRAGTSSRAGPPGRTSLDVGAAPGTDVYAPVEGSVVAVGDLVIGGRNVGSRIDLRPSRSPSVMVSVLNVQPDPAIAVGSPVLAASSKLGTAVNLAAVEKQALAAHASARRQQRLDRRLPLAGLAALEPGRRMRILFVGDVVGRPGRDAVEELLGAPGAPRRRRLHRQRRERRERHRRHPATRRPAARRGSGRNHARQPHVAPRGDRPVSRNLDRGRQAGQLPDRRAGTRSHRRHRRATGLASP